MNRRTFFVRTVGAGLLAPPFHVLAQASSTVPRIGVIGERSHSDSFFEAFRQGLRDLGYSEGRNIIVEFRPTQGMLERVPALVRELVRLPVAAIVVGGGIAAKYAMAETTTVPIVFATVGDPVATGLVRSLAHPGGNATGMSNQQTELGKKQLELLKTLAPRIQRVAVMYNPDSPISGEVLSDVRESARVHTIDLRLLEVRNPNQLPGALSTLPELRADALLVLSDPVLGGQLTRIARAAATYKLPSVYSRREFPAVGGLAAYGPSFEDNWRQAAMYVDKILKGARPAELPVQQPTRFELVFNLKSAKALGLDIPQSLLLRADEVIR